MSDQIDERGDAPADLSALDITRDPEAFERLASRIVAGAAPRLEARRRHPPAHFAFVLEWRRPCLPRRGWSRRPRSAASGAPRCRRAGARAPSLALHRR